MLTLLNKRKSKILKLISELMVRIKEDDLSSLASKMTFYILLSIFPFFIFLIEILKHTSLENPLLVSQLTDFFPLEIVQFTQKVLADIQNASPSKTFIPVAVILSLWAASKGIMSIIHGLNTSYRIPETRGYFFIRGLSVLYTFAFAMILLLTFALVILGNTVLALISKEITLPFSTELLIYFTKGLFSLFLSFLFFLLLYNSTPNKRISFKEAMPGAIFSTLCWVISSYFFSFYIQSSNSLSYMYGSISGVIALMLWLYVISNIILIGGELNALLFRQSHLAQTIHPNNTKDVH